MKTIEELLRSEAWKIIYDEGWRMWREGFDKLRKTESGMESARAKQQMEDAERILRIPLLLASSRSDDRSAYRSKLSRMEKNVMGSILNRSICEEDGNG